MKKYFKDLASFYRGNFSLDLEKLIDKKINTRSQVLHIGANKGQEAELYHNAGFHSVVWVEGFPSFYGELLDKIKVFPEQSAYQLFVSDIDEQKVKVRVADTEGASTILEPNKKFPGISFIDEQEFTSYRLDSFFRSRDVKFGQNGFLVLDIEGSELKALKGMGDYLKCFDYVLCEISVIPNYVGGPSLVDIDRFLQSNNFKRVKTWVGLYSGDSLYQRVTKVSMFQVIVSRLEAFMFKVMYYSGANSLKRWVRNWVDSL